MVVFSRLTFQASGIAIAAIVVASMSVHNSRVASNVAPVGALFHVQTASAEVQKRTEIASAEVQKRTEIASAEVQKRNEIASADAHRTVSNIILAVSRTPVDSTTHSMGVTNIDFTPTLRHFYP
jgi:hypothetical protein